MNTRVLLAIDGSEAAERAVDLCASIAWPEGTRLRVATVVDRLEPIIASTFVMPVDTGEIRAKSTSM